MFVDKEHQLAWMVNGGARQMNALQPLVAKVLGGETSGRMAVENGRLAEAGLLGAERSVSIAAEFRRRLAGETAPGSN